ncbi:hypothetical protein ACHAXN_000960 [Cyclotella atomus]|jgi:hypothetical protein
MEVPDRMEQYYGSRKDVVLHMKVLIYDTKQAAECFYKELVKKSKGKGYERTTADYTLFKLWTEEGRLLTDLTGRFPITSMENNQYVFVAYDYTTNATLVRAIKDRQSATIVDAFDNVFSYLANKGFKPEFNVLNNKASGTITE